MWILNWIMVNLFIAILLDSFDLMGDEELKFPNGFPETFKVHMLAEKELKDRLKGKKKEENQEEHSKHDDDRKDGAKSEDYSDDSSSSEEEVEDEEKSAKLIGSQALLKNWEKINRYFKSVDCEKSLYLFPQTNKMRIKFFQIISHRYFDRLILTLILLSTFRLILETFTPGDPSYKLSYAYLDIFFNICFVTEMILKIISYGFVVDDGSYLRDSWNQMDMLIVIFSLVDLPTISETISNGGVTNNSSRNIAFFKVLRLLRTFRPLRFISHNPQMKLLIICLFDSFESIFNSFIILVFIMFIFAVTGLNLFYSEYKTCYYYNTNSLTSTYQYSPIPNFIDILIDLTNKNVTHAKITDVGFLNDFVYNLIN